MERRDFIKSAAVCSASLAAGPAIFSEVKAKDNHKVKITVIKRGLNTDWIKDYREDAKQCEIFKDGQEFIIKSPWESPQGFCQWAWADIRSYILLVDAGAFNKLVGCCTDGIRPVYFQIEKVPTE